MVHVYKDFDRPDKELVEAYRGQAAATVYEASGRTGSVHPAVKAIAKGMRLLGPALTVSCHPNDNLMLHKAIQIAQPGDVIVAETGGYWNAGYFGGLMAGSAQARGIAGLAIDGGIRDSEEIIEMGFPIFSRVVCMRGTTKAMLGRINHPILFADVLVRPGDLVLGDDDGIVIVARERLTEVLEAAEKRVQAEQDKAEQLNKGIPGVILNKLDRVFASLGLVEE
jgi:4-hydroxy-4-methyl-2-oxoglutarate aldolase